jgi:hypothetical protein
MLLQKLAVFLGVPRLQSVGLLHLVAPVSR